MNQSQADSTTSCKGCCFADYEGDVQIGCLVKPMDDDFSYHSDGNREFRVINRMCHFKRGSNWYPEKEMDDKIYLLDKEVEIRYNVFIETGDGFEAALNNINRQTLQPQRIVGVDFSGDYKKYYDVMNSSRIKAKWFHQEFLDVPADWRDNMMVQHKSQFYVFLKPTVILPDDFFRVLSDRINYEDVRFGCIEEENMLIFPNGLYQLRPLPLREILKEIESLGLQRLRYEDIYTTVSK